MQLSDAPASDPGSTGPETPHARPAPRLQGVWAVVLGVALGGVAALLKVGLEPFFAFFAAYTFFYPALVLAAFLGGWVAGSAATLASALAAVLLARAAGVTLQPPVLMFLLAAASIVGLVHLFQRSEARLRREVAARSEAEAARSASEAEALARAEELAAVLDAVPSVIFIARDPKAHRITGNAAAGELLRVPPDSNMSRSDPVAKGALGHFEVLDSEGTPLPPERLPVQRAAAGEEVRNCTLQLRFDDGHSVEMMASAVPLPGPGGQPRGSVAVLTDISALRQTEAELRERESRFRLLAETVADVFYMTEENPHRLLYISPAFAAIWGRDPESMLGPPDAFQETIHPADRPRLMAALAAGRTPGEETRYRIMRPDGEVRWIADRSFEVPGRPGMFVGLARDITAEREDERRRALMLNELNHRARNLLAVVQGLMHQTLAGAVPNEVRDALESRLHALARAHAMLTEDNWQGADLGDIVEQTLAVNCPAPHRARASGPPVRVDGRTTMALTLGLQELAANALRHGAWSNGSGRVDLRWEVVAADPPMVALEWRESGGPPVAVPARQGFGTRLIGRGLAHDLGGTVELDWQPEGLVCRISARIETGQPQPAFPATPEVVA